MTFLRGNVVIVLGTEHTLAVEVKEPVLQPDGLLLFSAAKKVNKNAAAEEQKAKNRIH